MALFRQIFARRTKLKTELRGDLCRARKSYIVTHWRKIFSQFSLRHGCSSCAATERFQLASPAETVCQNRHQERHARLSKTTKSAEGPQCATGRSDARRAGSALAPALLNCSGRYAADRNTLLHACVARRATMVAHTVDLRNFQFFAIRWISIQMDLSVYQPGKSHIVHSSRRQLIRKDSGCYS